MHPVIHILSFEIESYLALSLTAFIVAALLMKHELKRNNYAPELYPALMTIGLTAGIIGSKVYYLAVTWNDFILSPYGYLSRFGSFGWYGGFVLGTISIVITLRIKKLSILKALDVLIPIVPICLAIGRLGCFLAGCCHGVPSDAPWALSFSEGMYPSHIKVHPTQLYEMSIQLCIFILLWRLRKREMRHGVKFSLYLVFAGLGRFVVEFYRYNPRVLSFLTAPQLFSILSIVLGTFIIVKIRHKDSDLRAT